MNANTTQPLSPADGNPADGNTGDSTGERSSAERVVLFGLAVALPVTPVLLILGTNWQAIQLLWITRSARSRVSGSPNTKRSAPTTG